MNSNLISYNWNFLLAINSFIILLLLSYGCSSGLKPGIYYSDGGSYSKMEVQGNRVILTTAFIPIDQSFTYKIDGNNLYLISGMFDMVFKIVNEDIIDGGIYGTFYHESYLEKIKNNPNVYKVTTNKLNVREGPGTDYKVIDQLYEGDYVYVIDSTGEWSKIQYDRDKSGYVSSAYLSKDK